MKNTLIFFGVKYFPSKGGTSRVVENIIRELVNKYNIVIYCYSNKGAEGYINGVQVIQLPKVPLGAFGVFIYYFMTALHLFFTQKNDCIIHAHKTDCSFFLPLLNLKFKNIVATSHEAPYNRDKWNTIGKAYFHLMEDIYIHSGLKLTSISKPLADYYYERYAINVDFIPNGINQSSTIDIENACEILKLNKISKPFVMFAARRIMSTKGLHTMLEALRLISWENDILIAGDVTHNKKYINDIKNNYADLKMRFIGYVELSKLLGLVKLADLFIFPSEVEGMSIMLLEVMSVGTHIICSDIPENKQLFEEDDVIYFKSKDAKDLMSKIKYAMVNVTEMEQRSIRARNKIYDNYKWDSIAASYSQLYNSFV